MESTIPLYVMSILRAVGGMLGGYLIGKGYITAEDATSVGGALLAVFVVLWSIHAKRQSIKALNDAIAAPSGRAKP